jgi:hypothetical protein
MWSLSCHLHYHHLGDQITRWPVPASSVACLLFHSKVNLIYKKCVLFFQTRFGDQIMPAGMHKHIWKLKVSSFVTRLLVDKKATWSWKIFYYFWASKENMAEMLVLYTLCSWSQRGNSFVTNILLLYFTNFFGPLVGNKARVRVHVQYDELLITTRFCF